MLLALERYPRVAFALLCAYVSFGVCSMVLPPIGGDRLLDEHLDFEPVATLFPVFFLSWVVLAFVGGYVGFLSVGHALSYRRYRWIVYIVFTASFMALPYVWSLRRASRVRSARTSRLREDGSR